MSDRIRAKFRVTEVTFFGDHTDPKATKRYKLTAIYDNSTPENERFTKATPFGELNMTVDNPDVQMKSGDIYYLDFTKAE